MDPNSANQQPVMSQPVVNPLPQTPIAPQVSPEPQQPAGKGGKKWLKIVLILLVLVILVLGGYFAYTYYFAQSTYNAGVYEEPQSTAVSPTPTPSGYQVNPSDTTDAAIDADTAEVDKNMTNLNSDINGVDQSVSDKQTNLQ